MKTILLTIALTFGLLVYTFAGVSPSHPVNNSADSTSYKLTITFANVTQRTGAIYIGIDNSVDTFNKESFRKTRIAVPTTGEVQVSFDAIPAGQYAIRVYQDLNSNQRLDFSGQMPTEPFGFSNISMLMGPPSFKQCAFTLDGPKTVQINLLGN